MKTLFIPTSLFFAAGLCLAGNLVSDDYSTEKHPLRKALRGGWTVVDGMGSVAQDDALYKKYKNHGPIMVYEVVHTDAVAVVEFKPTGCKAVVFTMDAAAGGHAFRVQLRSATSKSKSGSRIVTYAAKKEGAKKAEMIVLEDEGVPKFKEGEWNRVEVRVVGGKATVKIADKTLTVTHPRIAQAKSIAKLGFSFGQLSIRNFSLEGL
jgi:hypothetical protein